MYTTLFILIAIGTLLFYTASDKVKPENKPAWTQMLVRKPALARAIGTAIFLMGWIVAISLQGPGSGTFAMVGYLMTSYSLLVLLKPLRYFTAMRLAVVALVALILETVIF